MDEGKGEEDLGRSWTDSGSCLDGFVGGRRGRLLSSMMDCVIGRALGESSADCKTEIQSSRIAQRGRKLGWQIIRWEKTGATGLGVIRGKAQ